jgi:hypothetical protein
VFASVSASVGSRSARASRRRSSGPHRERPGRLQAQVRLHAYHYPVTFTVTKKRFNVATCDYRTVSGWPQRVYHAPAKANRNVWRLDKAAA